MSVGFTDQQVFESTEMLRLEDHTAYTHGGSITADHIIHCGRQDEELPQSGEIFHAQIFMSITEP
jgi:gamma-glutamylputrescine oxidase